MTFSNGEQLNLFEFKEKYPSLGFQLENIKKKWEIDEIDILEELKNIFYEYTGINIEENPEIIDIIIEMFKDDKFSEKFDQYLKVVQLIKHKYPEKIEVLTRPSEYLKKVKGEVFTPLSKVIQMLSYLPKEVWENPNLKWLDPSNGTGNFLYVVYDILMGNGEKYGINTRGLKNIIPDEEERRKHIIENMLYGFEIQLKNVVVSKIRLNPDGKYKDNIIHGDFFDLINKKEFQNKFDIIVGNPPYQYKEEETIINKRSLKGYKSLYEKFTLLSLKYLLKKNGILLFIHPSSWRMDNDILNGYLKYNILFVELLDWKTFSGVNVDVVLIKKEEYKGETKVYNNIFEEKPIETFNLKKIKDFFGIIPNVLDNKRLKIMKKIMKDETNKYKIVFLKERILNNNNLKGIIIRDNRDFRPILLKDFQKNQKTFAHLWFIQVNSTEEEKKLIKFFESEVSYWVSVLTKISQQHRNRKIFERLINNLENVDSLSKEEFQLIKDDINFIKKSKRKSLL